MNYFFNNILSLLAEYEFENQNDIIVDSGFNFSVIFSIIIGIVSLIIVAAIIVIIVSLIAKNKGKIAQAGKDMFGAISEGVTSVGSAIGDAAKTFADKVSKNSEEDKDEYTNCGYCGSSVNTKQNRCPNCGASIKRKSK